MGQKAEGRMPAGMKAHAEGSRGLRRILTCALIAALCAAALCGCTPFRVSGTVSSEDAAAGDLITVGFCQLGSESAWRIANTKSVEEALTADNGYLLMFNNARQRQDDQIKALRSYISQRVDIIVFCPVTETGWDTVLGEAKEADIPVIILDRQADLADTSLCTAFLGEDSRREGVRAGEWLEEELKKEGREDEEIHIAVLQGTTGSSAQVNRSEGFLAIASRNRNWHFTAQVDGEFTRAKGKEVMGRFLDEFADIDVLVAQNDEMALGALEAIEAAGRLYAEDGRKMIIISYDATREALEEVQRGRIDLDVECNPLSGPALDRLIKKIVNGESYAATTYMEEMVFTKENVGSYIDERAY